MYERRFGITGPPFQLSPDPSFFFDSDQHRGALAMLRHVFSHEAPIFVLSGEIGAGKTTVVRAWLEKLATTGTVVGQLANTQLDADELIGAIATSFGIATSQATGAERDASWRDFLHALKGRAALLVVDEAQNLDHAGLRSLVQLADTAVEESARFRICLVGQPELRARFVDPTLRNVQERVQQMCHLGPLQMAQTRQYVEHRLRKVGWAGAPAFEAAAFDEIHRFTGGVPRRINVLSNRLMVSQFLSRSGRIDSGVVIETANALYAEIGEEAFAHLPRHAAPESPRLTSVVRGALLLLVNGRSDHIKAVLLLHAIAGRADLPSAVVMSVFDAGRWSLNRDFHAFVGLRQTPIVLMDGEDATLDMVQERFRRVIERDRPEAIVLIDGDATLQCCAVVAADLGVPLVQVGADAQGVSEQLDPRSPRAAIGRLACLQFDCQSSAALEHWNPDGRLSHRAGSLLFDAAHVAVQMALQQPDPGLPSPRGKLSSSDRGFGVVALKPVARGRAPCEQDVASMLCEVSRELPLMWPLHPTTIESMQGSRLWSTLEANQIACMEEMGHIAFIRLLLHATCVITDSLDVQEEAAALGVPCLSLGAMHAAHVDAGGWLPGVVVGANANRATRAIWDIWFNGGHRATPPALGDGRAAPRIAARLARWLADRNLPVPADDGLEAGPIPGMKGIWDAGSA